MDTFFSYQKKNQQRYLDELFDLLKIPSVSAVPQHQKDCVACAKMLAQRLTEAGLDQVKCYSTKGNPIVYGEKIIDKKLPTVLVYGHYDVQPPDPLELWHTEPFQPTIRNGKIFARGASDDKGQMYMHVKAIESLLQTNSLPLNVKVMIEGEEEIGCVHLEDFVIRNKKLLQADVVLISDSAMISLKTPSIETGLRGLTYLEVELTSADRDLHSGVYGGAVANPIVVLTKMLASLHDKKNKITIPDFYKNVAKLSAAERKKINAIPFSGAAFKKEIGIKKEFGEEGYSTIERIGIRPTLEINGIWGGYTQAGAKTVLPAKAFAKISCRLVPHQSHAEIAALVEKHLKKITPPEVQIKITRMSGGEPYDMTMDSIEYKAAEQAMLKGLGKMPVPTKGGGSIPVVANFQKHLNTPVILLGFGLNDDNLHAPNEKFNIEHYFKGIETIAYFHQLYATMKNKKSS